MKTRLLGAAVLIALAVLFVPMFFSSSPPSGNDQTVSLAIPPAPDRDLQTRTMDLNPDAPSGGSSAPLIPSQAPVASDKLATVNIGSRRPRDVETDPEAGKAPEPTTVTPASAAPAVAPVQQAAEEPQARAPTVAPTPTPAAAPTTTAGTAARGDYTLNLSAYANTASAQGLIRKVQALGYPVSGRAIRQGGKTLTLVTAGPFDTRTAAEAARLRITQTIPGAPARVESGASDQHGDVAAKPAATATKATTKGTATARPGGYAVQVAAMASQADAQALRDKLRAAGFDGFVDSVNAGGKRLWRVRAGPQLQRDDALRVRDQIKAKLGLGGNVVSVP